MSLRNLVLAGAGAAALLATGVPAKADGDWGWQRDEWRERHWHRGYRPEYRPYAYVPPPIYYAPPPPLYYAPPPPPRYYGPPPGLYFDFGIR